MTVTPVLMAAEKHCGGEIMIYTHAMQLIQLIQARSTLIMKQKILYLSFCLSRDLTDTIIALSGKSLLLQSASFD